MKVFGIVLIVLISVIGAILAFGILAFSVVIITSLFINTKKVYNKDNRYCRFLINLSTFCTMRFCNVHFHVTGKEKLPSKKTRILLISNHRSNFDPIAGWYVFRKYQIAYITKPENLKIPFYGKIIQKCCCMPINRENPRLAIPTIERSIKLLKSDAVSVGVYPEGTRSKTLELLPFHASVFKIATKAEVPVVVTTIHGTEKIHKNFPFKRTDVYIDILEVISAEEVKSIKSVELSDKCEALIKANMDKYNEKQ